MHVFCIKRYIKIVDIYFKQECDACNINLDKDKVKIHNSKDKSFTLCHIFNENHGTQKDSCKKN